MKIGTVESLWRYPVKSMRGEEMEELFAGFAGVYGDRLFAFHSATARPGFPYLTARDQRQMLRYRPRFRDPAKSVAPPNLAAAESILPEPRPSMPIRLICRSKSRPPSAMRSRSMIPRSGRSCATGCPKPRSSHCCAQTGP